MTETKLTKEEYEASYKGRKIKKHLGDRHDGKRVRTLPPMQYVTAFVMTQRNDASNYFRSTIDMTEIDKYIRHKTREEGLVGFGFMHVMVAAYLRIVTKHPGLNRYISGQRIYKRDNIVLSMIVKKGAGLNAQGTAIKPVFTPWDNVYDVYNRMTEEIKIATQPSDTTALDKVARGVTKLPTLLLKFFVDLMRFLDYFDLMPRLIDKASPFHASLFVSNLGSVGIQPIYHHLYNFGNVPMFITFGSVYRKHVLDEEGNVIQKRFIDFTIVTDERITDGSYYADAMKQLARIFNNPWVLDETPAEILLDVD